mmetsp:Transcript_12808/g.17287  ORF Transcript_12808/g.17287 Transcript_12808/m.17287 type:complete len:83 (+) Transcript_12808:341-589(+)
MSQQQQEDLFPSNERDSQICQWLEANERGGYVRSFLGLQRDSPNVLGCFDDKELIEIFLGLPKQEKFDPSAEISAMLSNFVF